MNTHTHPSAWRVRVHLAFTTLVGLILWSTRTTLSWQPTGQRIIAVAAWTILAFLAAASLYRAARVSRIDSSTQAVAPDWFERLARPKPRKPAPFAVPVKPVNLLAPGPAAYVLDPRPQEPSLAPVIEAVSAGLADAVERRRISVLGPVTITGAGVGLRASAVELLVYLALRPHGARRDQILEALWPGDDPRKSRDRLYQATRAARTLLGTGALHNDRETYKLNPEHVTVDAQELEAQLRTAATTADIGIRAAILEHALTLVRGAPLAGSDYAWALPDIRHLTALTTDLLRQAGQSRLETGNASGALALAEQSLELDPLIEEGWQLALKAEARLGLRQAIEERYKQLHTILSDRLGLEPTRETRQLYLQLLGQK